MELTVLKAPNVARMVLRRLIGPILLWEEPRPEFIRWEATPKTDLLESLASTLDMASPTHLDNEGGATLHLASPAGFNTSCMVEFWRRFRAA
jgi:hypothetical protein